MQYHIYALAFPFDLRSESVTYTYNHYEPNWFQYSSLKIQLETVGGASLNEPHTSKSLLDRHFRSIYNKNDNQTLCDSKFSVVSKIYIPYVVIGWSVSQNMCHKVFLNGLIWSLDYHCRRNQAETYIY